MVHRNFSFSFRAPIARLLSSKQYAKAGMLGTTDKMAYPFSLPTDRKGRIVETLSALGLPLKKSSLCGNFLFVF